MIRFENDNLSKSKYKVGSGIRVGTYESPILLNLIAICRGEM